MPGVPREIRKFGFTHFRGRVQCKRLGGFLWRPDFADRDGAAILGIVTAPTTNESARHAPGRAAGDLRYVIRRELAGGMGVRP
jgi:hypothetical protein